MHSYIYICPDALRASPPPGFFQEIANLFDIWGAETHGEMHARSTVLHGWGLGGRRSPQGHSTNDMVNCVCSLPYGSLRGSFWRSRGVREVLGWIGGVQAGIEGPQGCFGGVLWGHWKGHFLFVCGGWEFVNCLMTH